MISNKCKNLKVGTKKDDTEPSSAGLSYQQLEIKDKRIWYKQDQNVWSIKTLKKYWALADISPLVWKMKIVVLLLIRQFGNEKMTWL